MVGGMHSEVTGCACFSALFMCNHSACAVCGGRGDPRTAATTCNALAAHSKRANSTSELATLAVACLSTVHPPLLFHHLLSVAAAPLLLLLLVVIFVSSGVD